jgi:hypothetical protein
MKTLLCLALLISATSLFGTVVEEALIALPEGSNPGTKFYSPSNEEKPFFAKLASPDTKAGAFLPSSTTVEKGAYVSWFGIIRDIFEDKKGLPGGKVLLIQVLYSDGFTDLNLQTVSINGPGDAFVFVEGNCDQLIPLMLVRFYGTVSDHKGPTKVPLVKSEFVRYWPWGMFNFNDRGEDHSSPIWRQGTSVGGVRIYSSQVSFDYYIERLGGAKEQIQAQSDWYDKNQSRIKAWVEKHENAKE